MQILVKAVLTFANGYFEEIQMPLRQVHEQIDITINQVKGEAHGYAPGTRVVLKRRPMHSGAVVYNEVKAIHP